MAAVLMTAGATFAQTDSSLSATDTVKVATDTIKVGNFIIIKKIKASVIMILRTVKKNTRI